MPGSVIFERLLCSDGAGERRLIVYLIEREQRVGAASVAYQVPFPTSDYSTAMAPPCTPRPFANPIYRPEGGPGDDSGKWNV